MKDLLNREFLDVAGERNFPLEEGATGLSDTGAKFPDNILTDAQITLSPTLGNSVFIVSASVNNDVISVTFAATDSVDLNGISVTDADTYGDGTETTSDNLEYFGYQTSFLENTTPTFNEVIPAEQDAIIPIGVAVASGQEVTRGLPIKVEALVAGVSGSVIFDSNTFENAGQSWVFSSYAQSALSRKAYHVIGLNRVELFKRAGTSVTASGDVTFDGENGLTVTHREGVTICEVCDGSDDIVRDVIEIGFTGDLARDNLQKYAGPCAVRPESRTCLLGTPITSINGVSPDSEGEIHILFPTSMKPYRMSGGIIIDTEAGLPIRSICGPRFASVSDGGIIGSDNCCEDDCEDDDADCTHCDNSNCVETERAEGARSAFYSAPPIIRGARSHVCLNAFDLVLHEYNVGDEGVAKTYLTFGGAVGQNYIYAEDVSDLSFGFVAHINVVKNTFHLVENGVINNLLRGDLLSTSCRTAEVVYIDATESEVALTIAPTSILDAIDSSQHALLVSIYKTPSDGSSGAVAFEANGYFCETRYGVFVPESGVYRGNYYIRFTPYGGYGFIVYDVTSGTPVPWTSGNMVESGGSSSGSSGSGNYMTTDVSFTYQGYDYSGTITSASGGCSSSS